MNPFTFLVRNVKRFWDWLGEEEPDVARLGPSPANGGPDVSDRLFQAGGVDDALSLDAQVDPTAKGFGLFGHEGVGGGGGFGGGGFGGANPLDRW